MRSDHRVICLVAGAALVGACKGDPKTRSSQIVEASDFWPEAPKATKGTAPRTFTYKPESIQAYAMTVDIATAPGAEASVTGHVTMGMAFTPGKAPAARDATLQTFDMLMTSSGQKMAMHLDHDRITVDAGTGQPVVIQRGQPGPFDVAAIVDTPIDTMTFTDGHKVETVANPAHPFAKFGGDSIDNAFLLFPDLPSQPVKPGEKWSMTRMYAPAAGLGKFPVTFEFEYAGDGACPSGAKACALLQFTASSGKLEDLTFGGAGKVFFDTERGAIDESRVRLDIDMKPQGHELPMTGSMSIKSIKS